VIAPATTGDATLVPDNDLQPPLHHQHKQTANVVLKCNSYTSKLTTVICKIYKSHCCKLDIINIAKLCNTYFRAEPRTDEPYVTISGFTRPYPPGSSWHKYAVTIYNDTVGTTVITHQPAFTSVQRHYVPSKSLRTSVKCSESNVYSLCH